MLAKLLFLPMMLTVLERTRRPLMCAVLYALLVVTNFLMFSVALGASPWKVSLSLAIAFFGSWLYFFLLRELEGGGTLYWGVLIVGLGLLVYF